MQQGKSGYGFTDRKVQWSPSAIYGRAKTSEEKLARLEHELAYTRQELEFVKIILADREAQREWESKHHRVKSSESSEK
ncbi:MAG: hypothetical protein NHB14_10075 [Desulfosporosinus sp.]|nr:hypothetical protein [Desulfosporosinus sp.]